MYKYTHALHFTRQLSPTCQMLFFSATYEERVMEFAEYIAPQSIIIRLKREEESLDNIKQYYVRCNNDKEKYQAIRNIYGLITVGQAIIFCQVRSILVVLFAIHNYFTYLCIDATNH